MKNFSYQNPVKIIFGKDTIKEISNEIPAKSKVLIIYGGGSIKKNGVYDQTIKALEKFEVHEFGGIEPNPHYETCMKAVELIKEKEITFIMAVGGGSVIDATKFIVAAACYEGEDPWNILAKYEKIKKALPYGTVLTLSATGSEMNRGAVITRLSTEEKLSFKSDLVFPKFSVLDPEVTYTLPAKQISNGIVDAFVHVVEQYLVASDEDTNMQDYWAESLLKLLLEEGPKALRDPQDYNARANLMWASTWALNGWIACGVDEDWATHMIGHELTAFYGLDHAQTLAIVLPGIMTILKEQKANKIIRLGKNVFGITTHNEKEIIDRTVRDVERFFESLGVKTRLSDYNLGKDAIERIRERLNSRKWRLGECQNITGDVAAQILGIRL